MINGKYTNVINSTATNYIKIHLLIMQGEFCMNEIMAGSIIYLFNIKKYLVDCKVIE